MEPFGPGMPLHRLAQGCPCPLFSFFIHTCHSNNEDGFVLHDADDLDRIEFIENELSQGSVVQDFLELFGEWVMHSHFYPILSLFYSI